MTTILGITLPPGPIEPAIFRQLLDIVIGPHGWIRPVSYGPRSSDEIDIRDTDDVTAAIYACLLEDGSVFLADHNALGCLTVRADRDQLSHEGMVYVEGDWLHFVSRLASASGAVSQIMALLRSPFAFVATSAAFDALAALQGRASAAPLRAFVQPSATYTLGLRLPHFRMWFGVEWTDFLGRDVLAAAPALESRPDGAAWFVQILEDPEQWNRPEGIGAAKEFAQALGRNVFYDPMYPNRPLDAPDLSHLMRKARTRYPHLTDHHHGWPPKLPPQ